MSIVNHIGRGSAGGEFNDTVSNIIFKDLWDWMYLVYITSHTHILTYPPTPLTQVTTSVTCTRSLITAGVLTMTHKSVKWGKRTLDKGGRLLDTYSSISTGIANLQWSLTLSTYNLSLEGPISKKQFCSSKEGLSPNLSNTWEVYCKQIVKSSSVWYALIQLSSLMSRAGPSLLTCLHSLEDNNEWTIITIPEHIQLLL